jgi:hypothetical protein
MPSAQSESARQGPGWHDSISSLTQSLGTSSHFSPGGHVGVAQPLLALAWHVQPFTQSASLLQLLSAWAGRAAKPSRVNASRDETVK